MYNDIKIRVGNVYVPKSIRRHACAVKKYIKFLPDFFDFSDLAFRINLIVRTLVVGGSR